MKTSRTNVSRAASSSSSDKDPKKSQEVIMEQVSHMGADRIRALGVQDRTKRAMLAESVEDRIFELVDEIEQLVASSKMERAVDLAKQVKTLQMQYQELVTGQPSSLLTSLESLGVNNNGN
jgi:hypothetical protein